MLDLHFRVALSCIVILSHQDANQGIRDDYKHLFDGRHKRSYKDISVGRGERRDRREVCEETEKNANTEEWQRCYQDKQYSFFARRDAVDFAHALRYEEEEADVDDQEDYEARFDHLLSRALFRNRTVGQVGAANDADDEGDRGGELQELEKAASVRCRDLVYT